MSRHHTLPPIVYTPPPPKPRQTRRRRGVGYAQGTREAGDAEDAADVPDAAPARAAPLPQHALPVEATERRTSAPHGKLSDDTLRAMLDVQEKQTR